VWLFNNVDSLTVSFIEPVYISFQVSLSRSDGTSLPKKGRQISRSRRTFALRSHVYYRVPANHGVNSYGFVCLQQGPSPAVFDGFPVNEVSAGTAATPCLAATIATNH